MIEYLPRQAIFASELLFTSVRQGWTTVKVASSAIEPPLRVFSIAA